MIRVTSCFELLHFIPTSSVTFSRSLNILRRIVYVACPKSTVFFSREHTVLCLVLGNCFEHVNIDKQRSNAYSSRPLSGRGKLGSGKCTKSLRQHLLSKQSIQTFPSFFFGFNAYNYCRRKLLSGEACRLMLYFLRSILFPFYLFFLGKDRGLDGSTSMVLISFD